MYYILSNLHYKIKKQIRKLNYASELDYGFIDNEERGGQVY